MGITYDAGALIAADRNDRQMWALHAGFLAEEVLPTVPSVVVAQAWRGRAREVNIARLLAPCAIEALEHERARSAGVMLGWADRSDVVDAVVVEGALRRDDVVVTSDPDDLVHLADAAGVRLRIRRI